MRAAALLLTLALAAGAGLARASAVCSLTGRAPSAPSPVLDQCYRHNLEACCVSGHDALIKRAVESLLSASCRTQYPDLERYLCLGCNPEQFLYTTESTIRICESFAQRLASADYAKCGLIVDPANQGVALAFDNATDFFARVPRPPFFDLEVTVVPDGEDCLSPAPARALAVGAVAAAAALLLSSATRP